MVGTQATVRKTTALRVSSVVLRTLIQWLAAAGLFIVFLNAFAIVLDALLRSWFGAPIHKLDDVSRVIFVIGAACCVPAATAFRGHITIRAFADRFSARGNALIEVIADAVALVIFALMTWQLSLYTLEVAEFRQTLSQIDFPIWPIWAFATAMLALTALVQFVILLDALASAIKPSRTSAFADAEKLGESQF